MLHSEVTVGVALGRHGLRSVIRTRLAVTGAGLLLAWWWCLPAAAAEDTGGGAITAWARVLGSFVDAEGRVDFAGIARAPGDLDAFVEAVARDGPRTRPDRYPRPDDVLAFHLNAYNALAMHGVIAEGIPADLSGLFKRVSFFRFRKVRVDGSETTLHDYENDVIRPLGDPRVHFALNCMVRDCPRLPRVPFEGSILQEQLEAATRGFLGDSKYLRVDSAKRTLWLSSILDFYTEDFAASGDREDLIPYVNRYLETSIPEDYDVRFMRYDWTINKRP